MCARYQLELDEIGDLADAFEVPTAEKPSAGEAFPGSAMPVVIAREGVRALLVASWGLIPAWSEDPLIAKHCFNARAETVAEKPAFRDSFKSARCIVPATSFFEWTGEPGKKRAVQFRSPVSRFLGFAGLHSHWKAPDGEERDTYTIITTAANADVAAIHDRMPVILAPDVRTLWLDPKTNPKDLQAMIASVPEGTLVNT